MLLLANPIIMTMTIFVIIFIIYIFASFAAVLISTVSGLRTERPIRFYSGDRTRILRNDRMAAINTGRDDDLERIEAEMKRLGITP